MMQILSMRFAGKRPKMTKQGKLSQDALALNSPELEPRSESDSKPEPAPLSPAPADLQTQSVAKSESEIITEFARKVGVPCSYAELEFSLMKKLYGATPELIIELYNSVLSSDTLSTFKLRYVRAHFRFICETKNKQKR